MSNSFDDLYDNFFDEKNVNKNDKISQIIQALKNYQIYDPEQMREMSNDELGEPESIEQKIVDGLVYTKYVWINAKGTFIRIIVTDQDDKPVLLTLEEQLQIAKDEEDWNLAIGIMEKINKKSS